MTTMTFVKKLAAEISSTQYELGQLEQQQELLLKLSDDQFESYEKAKASFIANGDDAMSVVELKEKFLEYFTTVSLANSTGEEILELRQKLKEAQEMMANKLAILEIDWMLA